MTYEPSLAIEPPPGDESDVRYSPILDPNGDEDGLAVGAGDETMPRAVFNRYVWPLMSDYARDQFAETGRAEVWR